MVETERLLLRELTEADAPELVRLNANPNVLKYLPDPPLKDEEDALRVLRTIIFPQYARRIGRWAVIRKEGGDLIGWCGLKHYPEPNEYDLGYRFCEEQWGKGYATESARAVLEYAEPLLSGERIVGKALVDNLGSRRVLEKVGLSFEAYVDEDWGRVAVYVL